MAMRLRFAAGVCALTTAAVAGTGAGTAVASANQAKAASVLHRGFVAVISVRTDRLLARVRVGKVPGQIAVTPDGRTA
jgi:DNA-binding beta-propeller fold protein YncE